MITRRLTYLATCIALLGNPALADTIFKEPPGQENRPTVTVGFSPALPEGQSAKAVVTRAIHDAEQTLDVAAYYFTDPTIVKELIAAKNRGISVRVILDRSQAVGDTQAALVAGGITCRIDRKHKTMHDKFIVVDGKHTQTGSYNYTISADRINAENVVYVRNLPPMAQKYLAVWERLNLSSVPCPGGGT